MQERIYKLQFKIQALLNTHNISHDIVSGSDIPTCNKIDKPLVHGFYRFSSIV